MCREKEIRVVLRSVEPLDGKKVFAFDQDARGKLHEGLIPRHRGEGLGRGIVRQPLALLARPHAGDLLTVQVADETIVGLDREDYLSELLASSQMETRSKIQSRRPAEHVLEDRLDALTDSVSESPRALAPATVIKVLAGPLEGRCWLRRSRVVAPGGTRGQQFGASFDRGIDRAVCRQIGKSGGSILNEKPVGLGHGRRQERRLLEALDRPSQLAGCELDARQQGQRTGILASSPGNLSPGNLEGPGGIVSGFQRPGAYEGLRRPRMSGFAGLEEPR